MELYLSGDIQGFNELYSRYEGRVQALLYKKIFDKSKIQDLSQQIFLKFHNSRGTFRSGEKFAPWFFTICQSVIIDYFRKEKIQYQELDFDIEDQTQAQDEFDLEEIKTQLKDEEYELIYEKFIEGKSYKELKEVLKAPETTLRKKVSRIILKLKKSHHE